jgi:hypothetical protein
VRKILIEKFDKEKKCQESQATGVEHFRTVYRNIQADFIRRCIGKCPFKEMRNWPTEHINAKIR